MSMNAKPRVRPHTWRAAHRNFHGVSIAYGRRTMFISNEHILSLATDLADHLENQKANANHSA